MAVHYAAQNADQIKAITHQKVETHPMRMRDQKSVSATRNTLSRTPGQQISI